MTAVSTALDTDATETALRLLNNVADARATLSERISVSNGIGVALEKARQTELTALEFLLEHRDRIVIMSEK